MKKQLTSDTTRAIAAVFRRLDYVKLGPIYCDEGGAAFWKAKREPCRKLGIKMAEVLLGRLKPKGRSLYVGAGVAEIPLLAMETMELGREVTACNLRAKEVRLLNRACAGLPFRISAQDGGKAAGRFDHLWVVSVLNDPERFPELAALSYGRANPATFDASRFARERTIVRSLTDACLRKLKRPGLVTTSVEEIPWIEDWCSRHKVSGSVEETDYPTALVGDPVCLIRIGTR
ncbi:MAG: hypothetical protein EPO61_00015 [Nitrospirae bacterium]|nr:MAG: hypothetical protein EPO61_00015 [Nitrospirota bacterium]